MPADPPFGRLLTAMVTPFGPDGALDLAAAADLATHLVDEQQHDGLVVNGTTGESPTTTDAEKADLVRAVVEAVGDRAYVIAGVGTFDTAHTLHLAEQATAAGASGLLIVTPYYSRPPQDALREHFLAVADATDLPVMLYDIPHRAGVPITSDVLVRVSEHPRIVAVKDAKGDVVASSQVMARCDLAYYAGDDAMTLPLLAVGGAGVVGTSTHFVGPAVKAMIEAYLAGRVGEALERHQAILPLMTGIFATQGVMLVKAGLQLRGRDVGEVRRPLLPASPAEREALDVVMSAVGV